jgi:hypothetical protein
LNEKPENIKNDHPSDEDLSALAEGNVSDWMRAEILAHVGKCEKCSFILTETASFKDNAPSFNTPQSQISPLKINLIKRDDSESAQPGSSGKITRPWRNPGDSFYFWIAASIFILSFLFESYRMQLLVATAFFGFLAILDYSHRNFMAPLIKAWREGDDTKAEEVIQELKDRFKIG